MTYRTTLIVAAALVGAFAAAPAQAGPDWVGLHIGPAGAGVSLGFGSWGVHGTVWDTWNQPLDFQVALGGYGEWVWVEGLGQVWRPWVAADWRPFTFGRWVWTRLGWTWVAYEPWGYFPHHFGSWAMASVGWVWRPGFVYSPANVVWVSSGHQVGWYACPPRGWSHAARGFHHGYSRGWRDGYREGWHDARYASFVSWDRLGAEDLHRHAVVGHAVPRGSRATVLAAAPSRDEVVRRGGRAVPEARLAERSVRVNDRTVTMARPEGVSRSIERHASETVERALRPDVARRLESARVSRSTERAVTGSSPAAKPASPAARSRAEVRPSRSTPALREQGDRARSAQRSAEAAPRSRSGARPEAAARIAPAPEPRAVSPRRQASARGAEAGTRSSSPSAPARSPSARSAPADPGHRAPRAEARSTRSRSEAVASRSARTAQRARASGAEAPRRAERAEKPERSKKDTTRAARR